MQRSRRKIEAGIVIKNKMQNTVVVQIKKTIRHPLYDKTIYVRKKYYAHDTSGTLQIGQKVKIMETRPLSKMKR